jgi:hypothetical protein
MGCIFSRRAERRVDVERGQRRASSPSPELLLMLSSSSSTRHGYPEPLGSRGARYFGSRAISKTPSTFCSSITSGHASASEAGATSLRSHQKSDPSLDVASVKQHEAAVQLIISDQRMTEILEAPMLIKRVTTLPPLRLNKRPNRSDILQGGSSIFSIPEEDGSHGGGSGGRPMSLNKLHYTGSERVIRPSGHISPSVMQHGESDRSYGLHFQPDEANTLTARAILKALLEAAQALAHITDTPLPIKHVHLRKYPEVCPAQGAEYLILPVTDEADPGLLVHYTAKERREEEVGDAHAGQRLAELSDSASFVVDGGYTPDFVPELPRFENTKLNTPRRGITL